jgi:hypothetical protein
VYQWPEILVEENQPAARQAEWLSRCGFSHTFLRWRWLAETRSAFYADSKTDIVGEFKKWRKIPQ